MRKGLYLLIALLMAGCAKAPDNMDINAFTGIWIVDMERTMEEAKKSPKFNENDIKRMPAIIKRMMARMKIEFTDKEMVYHRGKRKVSAPITVSKSDTSSITLLTRQGNKEITIVLHLIDKAFMNLKSSATDDMDFYIWKKAPAESS